MFVQLVFYFLAAVLVGSAVMVITARNPVHSALFLVLAFFTSAGVWLLLEAEFLAIILVLVYVGAVMVLFLFVVMMLDIDLAPLREGFARYLPLGAAAALVLVAGMVNQLVPAGGEVAGAAVADGHGSARALGRLLFTAYLYPFEIAGAVLLVAMIAAIAMTRRVRRQGRIQDPASQVRVRRAERVRLVDRKPGARD